MHERLKGSLLATLAMGALFAGGIGAARADDTAAEIRALKAQLRLLEQKVDAQARSQKATQHAVAEVAAKGAIYTKGPQPVLASLCPNGAISLKGICITPGGFIELSSIYRNHNLESDQLTSWNTIPFKNNRVGHTQEDRFSARHSRFSLLVQGNVNPATTLTAYAEVDFEGAGQTANFNQSNSFNLRERQIYGAIDNTEWGTHVLFGQTWSLATMNSVGIVRDKVNAPLTIDANYVPGFTYTRQPQFRIVKDFGPSFSVGVSAENPATVIGGSIPSNIVANSLNGCGGGTAGNTSGDSGLNACNTYTLNHVPDFVAKAAWDPMIGDRKVHIEGWGLARDFYNRSYTNGATASLGGTNHDVFGGGGGGSILVQLLPKFVDFQFSGAYGSGIGRYGTAQLPDVAFLGSSATATKATTLTETQLLAGLVVHATPTLDIYGYAGQEQVDRKFSNASDGYGNPNVLNTTCSVEGGSCSASTKRIRQATAGFWYTPYSGAYGKVQTGAQYSFTQRQAFADINGIAPKQNESIVMTSMRYYPF